MAEPTLILAHGAGAGASHPWMQYVAAALDARGVRVITFDFPYMAAGRRLPDKGPVLEAAWMETWTRLTSGPGPFFAAGKSMGGRIASQVAARGGFTPAPAGLVFFGYPLHPPNKPDQRRDRHLPDISVPMLFVHGTRDPFGTPQEMKELVEELPSASLTLVEGGDHSLLTGRKKPVGDEVLDRVSNWMHQTVAAGQSV